MKKSDYLPNSNLAPLEAFETIEFCAENSPNVSCDGFVLALACVFNDIRDMSWFAWMLNETPVSPIVSPQSLAQFGNRNGMNNYVGRLRIGALHECLVLIEENKDELSKQNFKTALKKTPKKFQKCWESLVEAALKGKSGKNKGPLRDFLLYVRNNGAFHYGAKAFIKGYRSQKQNEQMPNLYRERDFACRGPQIEGSRFFFGDAANEGILLDQAYRNFEKEISKYVRDLNMALRYIIGEYLKVRGAIFRKIKAEDIQSVLTKQK